MRADSQEKRCLLKLVSLLYVSRSAYLLQRARSRELSKASVATSRGRNPDACLTRPLLVQPESSFCRRVLEGVACEPVDSLNRPGITPKDPETYVKSVIIARLSGSLSADSVTGGMAYSGPSQFVSRHVTVCWRILAPPDEGRSAKWLPRTCCGNLPKAPVRPNP